MTARKLYQWLTEASALQQNNEFTVQDIMDVCSQQIKSSNPGTGNKTPINKKNIENLVSSLNEQALLIKRGNKLYELV